MTSNYENEYFPDEGKTCECWEELFEKNEYDSFSDDDDHDDISANLEYDSRTLVSEKFTHHTTAYDRYDSDEDDSDDDDEKSTQVVYDKEPKKYETYKLWHEEFERQKIQENDTLVLWEVKTRLAQIKEEEQKFQMMLLEEAHQFWETDYQSQMKEGVNERDACLQAENNMLKFINSLPTESEGARLKRLKKEKALLKAKQGQRKPLPFPHRRNGGGKGKVFEPPSEEAVSYTHLTLPTN